jgi:pimeloyl-ACP methyl ester carboxylesterase
MDTLHVVDFVAAAALGYAVAAVDGGESYWHRRASGEDRMAMLLGEFLPLLHDRFGLVPRAIMGWSMGGYGALLAAEQRPAQFRSVAVSSAAIWPTSAQQHAAVPDAFDGPADFAHNDVFAGSPRLAHTAVSISCGTADPFLANDRAFAARLHPRPAGEFVAGCHDEDFWRRMLPGPAPAGVTWGVPGTCRPPRPGSGPRPKGPFRYRPCVILPKVRDPRVITIRRGGTLTDADHRLLALWAAVCAEHVLPVFEAAQPSDRRPSEAIEHIRAWTRGETRMSDSRSAAGRAMAAARPLRGAARHAAYAAGQAAVVAHVAAHELGAAAYAIKAARAAAPGREEEAGRLECRWQRDQLPDAIRDLVLDDQRLRNAICWSVFDC